MRRLAHHTLVLIAAAMLLAACSRPSDLPEGSVSRTKVDFQAPAAGGNPSTEMLYVSNNGRGTLEAPTVSVAYADGADWLTVTVTSTGEQYAIAVQPVTTGLVAGTYRATLTLTWPSGSAEPTRVSVTLVVPARTTVPDPGYQPSVEAVAIDAPRGGGEPAPAALQVVNAGRGTLPVPSIDVAYAGTATGWLTTAVAAASEGYTVTVQARATGLPSGVHHATLTLRAAGGVVPPRTLPVTLTVPPPEVFLSTREIAMRAPAGGLDATATLGVSNTGGGQLAKPVATVVYEGGAAASWDGMLDVFVSGTPGYYELKLVAHQVRSTAAGSSKLPPGTYTATVQVSAPGAAVLDSARVTVEVPAPAMQLSSSEVAFSEYTSCPLPPSATVSVVNAGGGSLAAPVVGVEEGGKAWVDASVDSAGQDTATIRLALRAFPVAEAGGSAVTTVRISDPTGAASPVQLQVRFDALRPDLSTATVTPAQLDVRSPRGVGDPSAQTVSLDTPGGCFAQPTVEVEYVNAAEPEWISSMMIGSSPHRHDVSVLTTLAGLEPGDRRTATLHLRAGAATWDVPVTQALAVAPAGPLQSQRFTNALPSVLMPLADGRGLLTGGGYGTQVFDPVTRTWTFLNRRPEERVRHGAVELDDGRVLVCGGALFPGGTPTSSCEVLSGTQWSSMGSLTSARSDVTLVTMPRGRVLVVSSVATPEVLDLATGRSALLDGVTGTAAARRSDGSILVAGGGASAWLYSPELDSWAPTGDLAITRDQPALIPLADGRVLATGDRITRDSRTQLWDPLTGKWSIGASSATTHDRDSVVLLSTGKVLATSGAGDLEVFDPATGTWSVVGTYAQIGRWNRAMARLSNGVVVFAGGNASSIATMETFTW